jgi:hypothetical protein
MIRIAITAAAYDAIRATLDETSPLRFLERDATGEIFIWLEPSILDRLKSLRGPGESYSDVIIRLAQDELT